MQAQAMIAAYRELDDGKVDVIELEEHLERCASCRQFLALSRQVGEQVRALPTIEPPADLHAKLMRALAAEHSRFIQQSAPATPPSPDFLKPYLHEHAQHTHATDPFAAFSTAETGPLPILKTIRKRSSHSQRGHFVALALAAMFLMVLMMGGLTSLLLLAHSNPQAAVNPPSLNVVQPTQVKKILYSTQTSYQHVVSAVADHNHIYYTGYDDSTPASWMLMQLDRTTKESMPLFDTPGTSPLIVLGAANGFVVWLQFDVPTTKLHKNVTEQGLSSSVRTWSLRYLAIDSQSESVPPVAGTPQTLVSGTFDKGAVPDWIHTPVQGIWFSQNTLLVAMIDNGGISHLLSYELDSVSAPSAKEIANTSANPDHILASPTATSDGSQIYWSEEWRSDDGMLHSNIWVQQTFDAAPPSHGFWVERTTTVTQPLLNDGVSFHPVVFGNTLYFLSTADKNTPSQGGTPGTTGTPDSTATPVPTATVTYNPPTVSRADTGVYPPQIDESVSGTLLSLPLTADSTTLPTEVNATIGPVSSLQAGNNFLLLQSDNQYTMLDLATETPVPVSVKNALHGARFLAVNGDTAVWVTDDITQASSSANPLVTLLAFNWPAKG
jgi:hypothetical protein